MLKKFNRKKILAAVLCFCMAIPTVCFAEDAVGGSASSTITNAITSSATTLQSDAISMIGSVAPYALGIVGAFMLFRLGKKFFSQVGK